MIGGSSGYCGGGLHPVRMILPPITHRRVIDRELAGFFQTHRKPMFNRAISRMCRFYNVRRPRISWFEYLDWGKTAGKTYHDGRIHLVHPENWKRGRVYKTERMWVQMIYHEMAHFLFWTDAEFKADLFMRRMVSGLRPAPRSRKGLSSSRRSTVRAPLAARTRRQRGRTAAKNRGTRRARRSRAA
jgi:hypothetical protein